MTPTEIGRDESSSSRFIDYSCSTDWEKNVLKIENFVRTLVLKGKDNDSEIFSVSDMRLMISLHCNGLARSTGSYISHMFNIEDRYILVSRPGNNWLDCTTSFRHSLFSALVTSIQSCAINSHGTVPPIFLTMSNEENIRESKIFDVMGYQIFKRPKSSIVVNYSTIYSDVEQSMNEYRYVDGLVKLFECQLMNRYSADQIRKMHQSSNYFAQVTEISSTNPTLLLITKSDVAPTQSDSLSPASNISLVDSFWMSLLLSSNTAGNKVDNATPNSSMIEKGTQEGIKCTYLSVMLEYPAMKISSTVDNINFTTLVPSKQVPNCWSVNTTFNSPQTTDTTPLSSCIRRLLASFIVCKSCISAVTMASFSSNASGLGKNDVSTLFSSEKVFSVAMVLSEQSKRAVLDFCKSSSSEASLEVHHANYLLTNLFYGDDDESCRSPESGIPIPILSDRSPNRFIDSITKNLIEECANSNIELLSMYAISSGGIQGGMVMSASLWTKFVSVLRSRWEMKGEEGGEPSLPRVYRTTSDERNSVPSSLNDAKKKNVCSSLLLCDRLLWDDILPRDLSNSIIDKSLSILGQKLQALQFCILAKTESTICNAPGKGFPVQLQRRLPMTGDDIAQKQYILEKLRALKPSKWGRRVPCSSSPLDVINCVESEAISVGMKEDDINGGFRLNEEDRRMEGVLDTSSYSVNEEIDDIDQEGDDKIETTKSIQLHCWQIEMDIIISDMRAWKAAVQPPLNHCEDSGSDFDDFYTWYMSFLEWSVYDGIDNGSKEMRLIWSELWRHCTPCPALEQKPFFNAEAEAEKILGFADNLSPQQLASELLVAAIAVVPLMLWAKVQDHVSMATILIKNAVTGVYNEETNDVYTALGQQDELKQLCDLISRATEELLLDTTQYGAEEQRETAMSQRAILLIDEIANRTSEIEGYCHKVKAVCESLSIIVGISSMKGITMDPAVASILPFMIHDLCTCGTFVSSSKDDAECCYSLGNLISLCQPKDKNIDNEMSSNITDESIASIPAKFKGLEREKVSKWTPKEKIVKLWFKSGQHSLQTQRQQLKHLGAEPASLESDLLAQRMRASITEGESLVVSLRLSEEEFY